MSTSQIQAIEFDLNHDKLIEKLHVEERAAAAASDDDRPKTESTTLDENELYIIDHFRSELKKLRDWGRSLYKQQNTDREMINIDQELRALQRLKNAMSSAVNDTLASYSQKLKGQRLTERKQIKKLNGFRMLNKLSSEPSYPESKIFHYAIVFMILTLEAVLNTIIFAKGSDFGILGGFWEALLVATVNVGIAYIAGRFALPFTHHIKPLKQIGAWIGMATYFSSMLVFNLMAAHYRMALEISPDNPIIAAAKSFSSAPLQIDSFQAWMLFILGVIASVITLYKAYTEDDKYPGYGAVSRSYATQKARYEELKQETLKSASNLSNKHIGELERVLRHSREDLRMFVDLNDSTAKTNEKMKSEFHLIESSTANMIKAYRVANERIRHTPPPEYFSDEFGYSGEDCVLGLLDITDLGKIQESYENSLKLMNDEAQEVTERIQELGETARENAEDLFRLIEKMAEAELKVDEKEKPMEFAEADT